MVKVFVFLILLVIFYPLYVNKEIKIKKHTDEVVPIVIKKANFYVYKDSLEKEGSFRKLIFNNKNYVVFDIFLKDINTSNEIFAKKAILKRNLYIYNFLAKSKDLKLKSKTAIYFIKEDKVIGGEFNLTTDNYFAKGKEFFLSKDILKAKDIYARIKR